MPQDWNATEAFIMPWPLILFTVVPNHHHHHFHLRWLKWIPACLTLTSTHPLHPSPNLNPPFSRPPQTPRVSIILIQECPNRAIFPRPISRTIIQMVCTVCGTFLAISLKRLI